MILKINNPRIAIIESYVRPILYKESIIHNEKVVVIFR
jgi:hypothetical protein